MSYVIKADGKKEIFSSGKFKRSLLNAGASKAIVDEVVQKINYKRYDEIPTEKILNLTLKSLKKYKGVVARYDLKRAIMQLGPAGYSFEKYFAVVLRGNGYEARDGGLIKGKNITHEVDVIAIKDNKKFMIECKYHNQRGIHTRVKVPLYVYARFLDLRKYFDYPWIATNTKCTSDVINYARGVNMRITSWDFPDKLSLRYLIEKEKLYPISVLKSVGSKIKDRLFQSDIFLIKDLVENDMERLVHKADLSKSVLKEIVDEAKAVLEV